MYECMSVGLSVSFSACVCVCAKVGAYFPLAAGHEQTYGCIGVKLLSVDSTSHPNIVIRDFLLTLNKTPVSISSINSSS